MNLFYFNKIQQQLEIFQQGSLRMVTGDVFEMIRDDWARAWWSFTMETCRDIPSKIPLLKKIPLKSGRYIWNLLCYTENIQSLY